MKPHHGYLALCLSLFIFGLIAPAHGAGSQGKVDQGQPGNQGPWPVKLQGTVFGDAGSYIPTSPSLCVPAGSQKITNACAASTTTPATPASGRIYINVCNSPQNTSAALVKCRADGTAVVLAPGNVGDTLTYGDCITYAVSAATGVQCISDGGGNVDAGCPTLTSYECVPQ